MNSLSKKIITCILLVLFSSNMVTTAIGGVAACASQSCCCCDTMVSNGYELEPEVYTSGHGCCSPSAYSNCNLKLNYASDEQAFILPDVRNYSDNPHYNITVASAEPALSMTLRDRFKTHFFWVPENSIPIYLQNLTFIC